MPELVLGFHLQKHSQEHDHRLPVTDQCKEEAPDNPPWSTNNLSSRLNFYFVKLKIKTTTKTKTNKHTPQTPKKTKNENETATKQNSKTKELRTFQASVRRSPRLQLFSII
jgi:hypothetical protein